MAGGTAVTITFQLRVSPLALPGTVISNEATFRDQRRSQSFRRTVRTTVLVPDITGSRKTVDRPFAYPGYNLGYTLVGRNSGGYTATLEITDNLPRISALRLLTETVQASQGSAVWNPLGNGGYGVVSWRGELRPGEAVTVTFKMRVGAQLTPGAVAANEVLFREARTGILIRDAAFTTLRLPGSLPDLSSSRKVADKEATIPGQRITYALIAVNSGDAAATAQITDTLPPRDALRFLPETLTATQGAARYEPTANGGYGLVRWDGSIAAGQAVTITFQLLVEEALWPDQGGSVVTNEALFVEPTIGQRVNSSASTTVRAPDLSRSEKAVSLAEAHPGDLLAYTLVARNSGDLTATVQISDTLPQSDALRLLPASLRASQDTAFWEPERNAGYGVVLWSGQIAPGAAVTVTFDMEVLLTLDAEQLVTNRALFLGCGARPLVASRGDDAAAAGGAAAELPAPSLKRSGWTLGVAVLPSRLLKGRVHIRAPFCTLWARFYA